MSWVGLISINWLNTPGEFANPNSITLELKRPMWHMNTVFSRFSLFRPDLKSKVDFPRRAKISPISVRGTASSFVIAFSWRKSTQNLWPPSFYSTIGKLQGDLDLPPRVHHHSSTNFLLWIRALTIKLRWVVTDIYTHLHRLCLYSLLIGHYLAI